MRGLEWGIAVLLIIVGLINLVPVLGVFSAEGLESLYGLTALEPELSLLLRHRALLFGLLGSVIILSTFKPVFRPITYPLALISMLGFILLAPPAGSLNSALSGVLLADGLGVAICLLALAGEALKSWLPRAG